MTPDPPLRLGRYQLLRELGRGGFGVVYLAHDPKLDRQVAIKTITATDFKRSGDGEQMYRRLCREAHLAGSLSHPGIVPVYELEEERDVTYIVMQYVDGPTLAQVIADGGLSTEKSLELLQQTAAALDFAHSKGIVHRDIKPANLMLDECGAVRIADFGIAKVIGAVSQTHTTTSGTLCYMSPEQIRNDEPSGASDQFALAVIAYELLTGQRPFRGDSQASILHQILNVDAPRANLVNPLIPEAVAGVLRKALSKQPAKRYDSCIAFVARLRLAFGNWDDADVPPTVKIADANARRRGRIGFIAAGLAVLCAGAVFWLNRNEQAPRLDFSAIIATPPGQIGFPVSSPVKPWLAFARKTERWQIMLQSFSPGDKLQPDRSTLVSDHTAQTTQPAFSPDGERIAFRSESGKGGIFVVNLAGGAGARTKKVADFGFNPTWSSDGKSLCFAEEGISQPEDRLTKTSHLWVTKIADGNPVMIYAGDAVQPSWSPHGYRIAFWFVREGGIRDIATIPAAGGAPEMVTHDAHIDWNPVWSPDGRYLYFSSDRGAGEMRLWRAAIDERSGKLLGDYQALGEPGNYNSSITFSGGGKQFTYLDRKVTSSIQKIDFNPVTGEAGASAAIPGGINASRPQPSPDGKRVVFNSADGRQEDLFLINADGSNRRALLDDVSIDRGPRWSPDGKRIAFFSNRSGDWQIWLLDPESAALSQLSQRAGALYPIWSPDGKRLVYTVRGDDPSQAQSFVIAADGHEEIQLPKSDSSAESFTPWSWSPDGSMLAGYQQRRDGLSTGIAIYSFKTKTLQRITAFGTDPVWLNQSPRLLFDSDGKLYLADIRSPGNARFAASVAPYAVARRGFGVTSDDRTIYISLEKTESHVHLAKSE